jgi:hypothetical protein
LADLTALTTIDKPQEGSDMTEIPGQPPDYAAQLRSNWHALSDPAAVKSAGLTIQPATPAVLAGLPAVATGAVTAAPAAGKNPLQIVKYAEIVNGKVTAIVDDGSAIDDAALAHFVVTVLTAGALPAAGVTYQMAARPQGPAAAPPAG